jgi:hypothetical protein
MERLLEELIQLTMLNLSRSGVWRFVSARPVLRLATQFPAGGGVGRRASSMSVVVVELGRDDCDDGPHLDHAHRWTTAHNSALASGCRGTLDPGTKGLTVSVKVPLVH